MALTVGSRLGHYDVTALIGEGGMGQVYQATDTKLNRQVALKILPEAFASDPDRLARFQREAQVLASLNHPGIAAIYGIEEAEPSAAEGKSSGQEAVKALVLELVEGPTLADRIAQGPIPVDEALPIAKQIAEALEAAHEQGVIHRDLKPANIKLKDDGVVKVLDFGLARAFQPDAASGDASLSPTLTAAATQAGLIMGTAAYMAPEQAKGKPVDKRVDIWAFGAVLYEMLTGRSAFAGEDVADTLAFVLTRQIDWTVVPSGAPEALQHLLQRCLERNPKQRLRDIGDARADLDDLVTGTVALPRTASMIAPTTTRQYSFSTILATALASATIVGIGVWSVTLPEQDGVFRFYGSAQGTELIIGGSRQPIAISPDGQIIAFATAGSPNQLRIRSVDQLDYRTVPGTGDPRNPFFSPDSEWLGFFDGTTLKRVSVRGGPATAIVEIVGSGINGASWASDSIVFATNDPATGLLRVPAGGGEVEVLTVPTAQGSDIDHRFPQVLPGGNEVLFTIINTGGGVDDAQIAVLDLETGEYAIVVQGGSHARYVPTGHLVYGLDNQLWAIPFDLARMESRGVAVLLVDDVVMSFNAAAHFSVSNEGSLVYVGGATEESDAKTVVWVDRQGNVVDTGIPPGPYVHLRLSPDDARVALDVRDENNDVWIWEFASEAMTRLTASPESFDRQLVWSPDGQRIIFSSSRVGGQVNVQASGRRHRDRRATDRHTEPHVCHELRASRRRAALWGVHPRGGPRRVGA